MQPRTRPLGGHAPAAVSDGRTIERHYAVETADVDAIRRAGSRATEQATADRMTAIIADGPVES